MNEFRADVRLKISIGVMDNKWYIFCKGTEERAYLLWPVQNDLKGEFALQYASELLSAINNVFAMYSGTESSVGIRQFQKKHKLPVW